MANQPSEQRIDQWYERVKNFSDFKIFGFQVEKIIRALLVALVTAAPQDRAGLIEHGREDLLAVKEGTLDAVNVLQGLRMWRPFTEKEVERILAACQQVAILPPPSKSKKPRKPE